MKPSAKRLYGILLSLVLVIGSLVVYSSLLLPEYKDIQELRGEKVALAKLLQEEETSVNSVHRLLQQYDSISGLRETISFTLPSEEGVASIVNQIQGIALTNGMLLNSLSLRPLPVEVGSDSGSVIRPFGSVRILLNTTGSYGALEAFLSALETNIRIMDVYSLKVSGGGVDGSYKYQMEVDTYYQL